MPMHMYGKHRRRHDTSAQRVIELLAITLLLVYLVFLGYQLLT
jgi:hypothetical protein